MIRWLRDNASGPTPVRSNAVVTSDYQALHCTVDFTESSQRTVPTLGSQEKHLKARATPFEAPAVPVRRTLGVEIDPEPNSQGFGDLRQDLSLDLKNKPNRSRFMSSPPLVFRAKPFKASFPVTRQTAPRPGP